MKSRKWPLRGRGESRFLRELFRLLGIFGRGAKVELAGLLATMVAAAAVETAGIGSVLPFFAVAANAGTSLVGGRYRVLLSSIGVSDGQNGLVVLGLLVIFLILFGNTLSAVTLWWIGRFSAAREVDLSARLFASQVYAPLTSFVRKGVPAPTRNILQDVVNTITWGLMPFLDGVSRAVVGLGIVAVLAAVDPGASVAIGVVLGGSYALLSLFLRRRFDRLASERSAASGKRFAIIHDAFAGLKEIRLFHAESYYIERFTDATRNFTDREARLRGSARIPRFVFDSVVFTSVVLLVLIIVLRFGSFNGVVPRLSFYAFAAYRFLPAIQSTFRGIAELRYNLPSVREVCEVLTAGAPDALSPVPGKAAADRSRRSGRPARRVTPLEPATKPLVLEDIDFSYEHGSDRLVLDRINVTVPPRNWVAIVGSTGSGKSTLLELVAGLHEPTSRTILLGDVEIRGSVVDDWQARIGMVPQHFFLANATVSENIAFGIPRSAIDQKQVERVARAACIHEFVISSLPEAYETYLGENGTRLSGGQRQRIGLARALYRSPDVLLLDEATASLDLATEADVIRSLLELDRPMTVLLAAHRKQTFSYCDSIYVLSHGVVVASGTYGELAGTNPHFQSAIGASQDD